LLTRSAVVKGLWGKFVRAEEWGGRWKHEK
jgi:hypothetical protein